MLLRETNEHRRQDLEIQQRIRESRRSAVPPPLDPSEHAPVVEAEGREARAPFVPAADGRAGDADDDPAVAHAREAHELARAGGDEARRGEPRAGQGGAGALRVLGDGVVQQSDAV